MELRTLYEPFASRSEHPLGYGLALDCVLNSLVADGLCSSRRSRERRTGQCAEKGISDVLRRRSAFHHQLRAVVVDEAGSCSCEVSLRVGIPCGLHAVESVGEGVDAVRRENRLHVGGARDCGGSKLDGHSRRVASRLADLRKRVLVAQVLRQPRHDEVSVLVVLVATDVLSEPSLRHLPRSPEPVSDGVLRVASEVYGVAYRLADGRRRFGKGRHDLRNRVLPSVVSAFRRAGERTLYASKCRRTHLRRRVVLALTVFLRAQELRHLAHREVAARAVGHRVRANRHGVWHVGAERLVLVLRNRVVLAVLVAIPPGLRDLAHVGAELVNPVFGDRVPRAGIVEHRNESLHCCCLLALVCELRPLLLRVVGLCFDGCCWLRGLIIHGWLVGLDGRRGGEANLHLLHRLIVSILIRHGNCVPVRINPSSFLHYQLDLRVKPLVLSLLRDAGVLLGRSLNLFLRTRAGYRDEHSASVGDEPRPVRRGD